MQTPLFLDLDQVMRLHTSMIERYGGTEGTRDVGLLQSAVAMPQMAYGGEYLHVDVFEMAPPTCTTSSRTIRFLTGTKEPALRRPSCFWPCTTSRSRQTKTGLSI